MTPKTAEKLQNEIYRKMSRAKKLRIASQLFLFGKKLEGLKNLKDYDSRKASLSNSKNFRQT